MSHAYQIFLLLLYSKQEMLSELADILAAEEARSGNTAATPDARRGSQVSMGALTAAVHLLQWDQQVVNNYWIYP